MEILRKERKERDVRRGEEDEITKAHAEEAKKMDESAITSPVEPPHKKGSNIPGTGELLKRRN